MKYAVWYMRPSFFPDGIIGVDYCESRGVLPDPLQLDHTHIYLLDREARSLDDLFLQMQAEHWSPNGEARKLIEEKGLKHTSMSVGDIAVDLGSKIIHVCDNFGWVPLGVK